MADHLFAVAGGVFKRLLDIGDGSHAEVVAAKIVGPSGNVAEVDGAAGALVIQGMVHRMIHTGVLYEVGHVNESIADNGVLELLVTTAADQSAHMRFSAVCGGDARISLFENPTITGAGTGLSEVNRNRLSSNAAQTVVTHTPTHSADGTQLMDHLLPGGSGFFATGGASESSFEEFILKANEQYLFRVTNIAGSAQPVGAALMFYEPA